MKQAYFICLKNTEEVTEAKLLMAGRQLEDNFRGDNDMTNCFCTQFSLWKMIHLLFPSHCSSLLMCVSLLLSLESEQDQVFLCDCCSKDAKPLEKKKPTEHCLFGDIFQNVNVILLVPCLYLLWEFRDIHRRIIFWSKVSCVETRAAVLWFRGSVIWSSTRWYMCEFGKFT